MSKSTKIFSRLVAFALVVKVCVAHYENVILDREELVRLSQMRAETSKMDVDRKCEVLEVEVRQILSSKVGPIESRAELFSTMISILSNRKLPFNNDQPIVSVLEACMNEQSHGANVFKREVIASPSLSRQESISSSQSAMREAIGEFQEVKSNVKDFGKDLYHQAADNSIAYGHEADHHDEHLEHLDEHQSEHLEHLDEHQSEHLQHHGHDSFNEHESGHLSGGLADHHDEHIDHVEHYSIDGHPSTDYEHEMHEEVHGSSEGGMKGFVSNLVDRIENNMGEIEDYHDSHHASEFIHSSDDHHHEGAFANGLADRLSDQLNSEVNHGSESYTDSYHEHSVHDNGAHLHGKEESVHLDVTPDGSQRSSYTSVNEYSHQHQHSSDSSALPSLAPTTIVDDHDHHIATREAELRALEHEVSVKQEEINFLNEKIHALEVKYELMANNPPIAQPNPVGDARFYMMKEQYEQAARREEATARLLSIARTEIADKDRLLQVLIEKDKNYHLHQDEHDDDDEDDNDDDDNDDEDDDDDDDDREAEYDYKRYHSHHRKSFGIIDVADKLQDKMSSHEPLEHRCYKYYLAFDATRDIDKETTKRIGKTKINGPIFNYRISDLNRMQEISNILIGSGVKRAIKTGKEIRACFLEQRNLWWENNNSVYKGHSMLRSGGQIPPIPPMPPMPTLGRR